MLRPVERYSPVAGRKRASVLGGRLLRGLVIALVLYLLVSRFLAGTYRIESVSMEPGLSPADRVVVSFLSYGARLPFSDARFPGLQEPSRGDLVMVQPPFSEEPSLVERIFEPLVSFFTGQRATLHRDLFGGRVNAYMVKRLVGMPGDTIRFSDYVLFIKPRGGSGFVPEQRLVPAAYQIRAASAARGWDASLPLSGSSSDMALADDQYFVLGDNRTESSDSRSWGPVTRDRIIGKVIYRYWPPGSIGAP